MTDLPSCELVQRFMHEAGFPVANPDDEMVFPAAKFMKLASRLIQHGADQQLELDARWLDHNALNETHLKITPIGDVLKEAMRSKPPSLKERALKALRAIDSGTDRLGDSDIIRQALEQLDD